MEYGIQIEPQFGYTFDDVLTIANLSVKNGFSTIWFSDHFMLDKESTDRVLLDPWLLMASLVQRNSKVRVGSMVFCQSYRNPALTAKMAATLDVLANGRFDFGIGAGWKEIEYHAYGYPFPDGKIRIEELIDTVQIIRGIWTNEQFSFKGKHYHVKEVISFPKPVQKPMPIWIGAQLGREMILRVTAKYGDGVNFAWTISPKDAKKRFDRIAHLAKHAGRDASRIMKSIGLWTHYFDSETEMDTTINENAAKRNISPKEYRQRIATGLWGTPEDLITRIQEFQEIGVTHFVFMFPEGLEREQIVKFGTHVLPKL